MRSPSHLRGSLSEALSTGDENASMLHPVRLQVNPTEEGLDKRLVTALVPRATMNRLWLQFPKGVGSLAFKALKAAPRFDYKPKPLTAEKIEEPTAQSTFKLNWL